MKIILICPFENCGKAYSSRFNLRRHTDIFHMGLALFQCHICRKNLSSKQNLKEHMNIHTGLKPYVCNICGERFKQGSLLCVHKKSHRATVQSDSSFEPPKLTDLINHQQAVDISIKTLGETTRIQLPPLKLNFNEAERPDTPE